MSRISLAHEDLTERLPARLLRDRADTVRIVTPPPKLVPIKKSISIPPLLALVLAGILFGSIVAIVYAYRPGIG